MLLAGCWPGATPAQAQQYLPATTTLPMLAHASIDTVDFDGDRDTDIVVTGAFGGGAGVSRMYLYDDEVIVVEGGGIKAVSEVYLAVQAPLPGIAQGVARWADYNGDGDPDLLLAGRSSLTGSIVVRAASLFLNTIVDPVELKRSVEHDPTVSLPGVSEPAADWGDYDADGDPDLLLAGDTGDGRIARIYRNDPSPLDPGRRTFTDIGAGLLGVSGGWADWGDYDGDGDLDLALSGHSDQGLSARVYRNDGGAFTVAQELQGVFQGQLSWGDYDNDDDLDLLLSGAVYDPYLLRGITHLYRNDGGGFSLQDVGLPGTFGSSSWGDYDADGDLDILLSGQRDTSDRPFLHLYENENDGAGFTRRLVATGYALERSIFYRSNLDDHLDILTMGYDEDGIIGGYLRIELTPLIEGLGDGGGDGGTD